MASLVDNCSVIKEINKADEAIKICYARLHMLENKLRENTLPAEKQDAVRNELQEVRKLLQTNKDRLSKLQGHNRKSFMLAIFIAFLCFMFYMFYVLIFGLDY